MIESEELKEYILAVKKAIRDSGSEGFWIKSPIKLDIATTTVTDTATKISIKIAGTGTEIKTELVSRIQINLYFMDPNKPKHRAGYI